jgi:protocatechuate 3,4-dioxygenase beta subunit
MDGVVREDITTSLGSGVTAEGVPLEISLTLVDNANGCVPLANAAVYLWHADEEGRYSMYSDGVTNDTFLRGVQSTNTSGVVTFKTIFPGCYDGRWPHMHYEVYASEADATSGGEILLTSQIAFPKATCDQVYADSRYPDSASNLSKLSLETDGIFSDSADEEMATISGDLTGLTATVNVSV